MCVFLFKMRISLSLRKPAILYFHIMTKQMKQRYMLYNKIMCSLMIFKNINTAFILNRYSLNQIKSLRIRIYSKARHLNGCLALKHTKWKSMVARRGVRQSSVICVQWPVRSTAAGGLFKVLSNDLPEES